jgi:L-iditol 2-dehydrogenase
MKAYVLHDINDLRYDEVGIPECPKGWAIVQVKAAGICSSDIARVFTKGTYHFPTIPGHEFSGIVYSVSDTENEDWIGKRVGAFPLIPCRQCPQCKESHFEMCAHYDYIGSRRDGAFAEFVAVPVWNLVLLPDSISFEVAALLEPLSVGLHAVKIADVRTQDSVAIVGTGMIGISAAQWAKQRTTGKVVVIGRNETKRQIVESTGSPYEVRTSVTGKEYDVVIEAVGNPQSIDLAINMVHPGGTVVLMGNPSGDIHLNQNTYWRVLRKQLKLIGTWNSSYDGANPSDWTDAVSALSKGDVKVESLISNKLPQEHLMDGLKLMQSHVKPYCKVMTIWNS